MSDDSLAVLLWCWHDVRTDALQARLVRSDTAEEVLLRHGLFLLRCWSESNGRVERCLIRHLASSREAYIQGGPKLRDFVKACLLNDDAQPPADGTTST